MKSTRPTCQQQSDACSNQNGLCRLLQVIDREPRHNILCLLPQVAWPERIRYECVCVVCGGVCMIKKLVQRQHLEYKFMFSNTPAAHIHLVMCVLSSSSSSPPPCHVPFNTHTHLICQPFLIQNGRTSPFSFILRSLLLLFLLHPSSSSINGCHATVIFHFCR